MLIINKWALLQFILGIVFATAGLILAKLQPATMCLEQIGNIYVVAVILFCTGVIMVVQSFRGLE